MSSIKTTQIDGDVSVGRNATLGGAVNVAGNVTIGHNLKVEGWLDAKNIKGANKGIFTTLDKLKDAYPTPHDGWYAIVGKALPGPIYVGDGGEWVATGEEGGNPTVDSEQYNEAVAELQSDMALMQEDIKDIEDENNSQESQLDLHTNSINAIQSQLNTVQTTANEAKTKANSVGTDLSSFKATKGAPNGIAPLDGNGKVPEDYLPDNNDVIEFAETIDNFNSKYEQTPTSQKSTDNNCRVVYCKNFGTFMLEVTSETGDVGYFAMWLDSKWFGSGTTSGVKPSSGKVYIDTSKDITYRWNGSALVAIGSGLALGDTDTSAFSGSAGKLLQDDMKIVKEALTDAQKQIVARSVVNVNELLGLAGREITFAVALDRIANLDGAEDTIMIPGVVLTFLTEDGWQSKQWTTGEWSDESNWKDFGTNGENIGNTINVNALCEDIEYTLSTAIQAVQDLEEESGLSYFKTGVVLTFKTADTDVNGAPIWLSYQFTRDVSDINSADEKPWVAFGNGGGNNVETADTPEEGGKNALSVGGAYEMQEKAIGGYDTESDEEYIYYKAVNLNGKQIEDVVIQIPKNTGGSSSSEDSTLSIYFEEAAPTVAFGGEILVNVALRSVSYPDGNEVLGVIRNLAIIDASTGLTLFSEAMNEVGSASATDYKFQLDFTDYFSGAASKSFFVQATDADGNVKKKAITIVAVDVTVEQPMALNYTSSTTLTVGGAVKAIGGFYKFPNNSSSILAVVEMLYNGEWKMLGEATVSDSYTKSISVNPNNVFGGGERLLHGAYPVRIYGIETKSGVRGNTIYSAIMCVDADNTTPIVALRFNDTNNGKLRLYDNLTVEVAAYTSGKTETHVEVYYGDELVTSVEAMIAETIKVNKQIQGFSTDGTQKIVVHAESGSVSTNEIEVTIQGSAIGAVIKDGALFGLDFATRSNSESDHTIKNNGVEMVVKGSNYSSNGFVDYLGERCLRIAENMTAEIGGYTPYGNSATERTTGNAIQFAFATKNIKDSEAKLIECYDPDSGAGFYVCGNKAAIYCKTGQPALIERRFRNGEKHTMAVVVEPSTIYVTRGGSDYSCIKLYIDGEEVGCIGYISNSGAIYNSKTITFNGTDGDLYLYYFLTYDSHYEWAQAFQNYLCKLTDTTAMIVEYENEDVLDTQNRPTLDKLKEKGIPYYVVVQDQSTFDTFDGDIDTSTKFACTLYYYHPTMPWRSFKAINVQWRRQGTTSAKRPVKNDRFYLRKNEGWEVTPIYPEYTNEDALTSYELMKLGYVRVGENTIPVCIITVKVDYSDSSGVNDCGVCDLMNDTYRALGNNYMTPAQRAFDGTWEKGNVKLTGLQMNHSTANHPIAGFRSTMESLTDAWFHAKGNWKEDKGEQVALGFLDTPGYNLGCVNYGDFIEYFGKEGESLDDIEMRFKNDSTTDKRQLYLLSLYCGENYRFMAYESGAWTVQKGEMKQVNGKWQIIGKVLNPVSGYELLSYDGLNWWQGVGSIADMMEPTTAEASWVTKLKLGQPTYPMWTRYFECMIDDDQLQEDLAMGRKVPYELYQMLVFCNSCDYSKAELADTWQNIWKTQMWKYANPYSLVAYYLFTDYLAAVDQQAKNMQPMWFLEDGCSVKDGVYSGANGMNARRMYCNKVYDCDTCNGKDNDGGQTIDPEVDPGDLTSSAYAGRGSVLWNNIRGQQTMDVDQNGNTITLSAIADTMRSLPDTLGIGSGPFSPKGALHYFVEERLKKWPKVVSSYDGERKYIKYTGYSDLYFYALQGLGLTSLPAFIEQRWRIRDGYYRCGDFKAESGYIGGRIGAKDGAVIRFKAAKTGYFGIGNDSGNITEGIYLQAGEDGVFSNFQHGENIMLYIYQADRMSMLDLSEVSIDPQFGNTLSKMALLQELYLGSETHGEWTMSPGNTGYMTNLDLGDMPFLRVLDVCNTEVQTINASKCPRLESVNADGTNLSAITVAQTSPIHTLALPASITELDLVNLPNLTYPGGLSVASFANVNRLWVEGCNGIDTESLVMDIATQGKVKQIRIPGINVTASVEVLRTLQTLGVIGLDGSGNAYEESGQCSGITGRWILTELVDDTEVSTLSNYFKALEIHNSQFSMCMYTDTEEMCENITNLDNKTGYGTDKDYVASGHVKRLEEMSHAYRATYNADSGVMMCKQLSDDDYNYMADGTSIDLTDGLGIGYDIMKHVPSHWYKGVNDFKNQCKYSLRSICENEPLSTSTKVVRAKLKDILVEKYTGLITANNSVGGDAVRTMNSTMSVYCLDVEGMKQVRWPGVNSGELCGVFLDSDDKIISIFTMQVNNTLFDFMAGEDYIFCDVPSGAVKFMFTSPLGCDEQEAIAVDSSHIEAIEPDWVYCKEFLVGVYGMGQDGLNEARSVSGTKAQVGAGTSVTWTGWTYDADGNVTTQTAPTSCNLTCADFLNLCEMRGKGFHAISYEESKNLANIIMELVGNRNIQAMCGYGVQQGYTTGRQTLTGNDVHDKLAAAVTKNINEHGNKTLLATGSGFGNLIFGIQNFVGGNGEWMSGVVVNAPAFKTWKKDKKPTDSSTYPLDSKWHIYDHVTDEEREVQGINNSAQSGYCIGRVRHGRYMDTIAAKVTSDNSAWNKHYSDGAYYTHSRSRVVFRSNYGTFAYGGLVCASASGASSYSFSNCGSRLAFSGTIEIEKS